MRDSNCGLLSADREFGHIFYNPKLARASTILYLVAVFPLLIASTAPARAAFTFDDIQYWVGSGANRAAVAIDWSDGSTTPPALVWGFRWNGTATGRDMLTAVVAADDRLFAKFDAPPGSAAITYGLGYDANNNGQFAISDSTHFDSTGNGQGNAPFFPATSIESGDYYAEGWTFGFWHYGIAASDPFDGSSAWSDSQTGMVNRALADGAWDSWTFTPTFNFMAFAQNPQAAAPPFVSLPGDFNGDHQVDAADYMIWRATFGSTPQLAADANHNGIVDAADYTIWRDHVGQPAGSASSASSAAEPSTLLLALCSLSTLWLASFLPRKDPV